MKKDLEHYRIENKMFKSENENLKLQLIELKVKNNQVINHS